MKLRAAVGLICIAGPAQAHSFKSGSDLYAQLGEGIALIYTDPRMVIAPVALAIASALHAPFGFPRQWVFLLAGIAAGQLIAPLTPPAIMIFALVVAALTALSALSLQFRLLDATALLVGAVTAAAALSGHGFLEVPSLLRIGLFIGISAAAAIPAALAGITLNRFQHPITPILMRIAASWCAAIAIMLAAFTLKGLT